MSKKKRMLRFFYSLLLSLSRIKTEKINNIITEATKIINNEVNIFRIISSSEIMSHIPNSETTVIRSTNVIKM